MAKKEGKGIHSWAEDDRPREKMLKVGAGALSNAELLALLIHSGNVEENAIELSKRILKDSGDSLIELSRLEVNDLMRRYRGIGLAKAVTIKAALELGRRRRAEEPRQKARITSSLEAYELFQQYLEDRNEEHFYVLFLNKANEPLGEPEEIGKGGMEGTVVDPKVIMRLALEKRAVNLILAHNHPSGNLQPSPADERLTQKLKQAGQFLDIQVLDHLIIGKNKYYSFADHGSM
ncbi:MAG: RadC family protein [Bacteroidales bacterium]